MKKSSQFAWPLVGNSQIVEFLTKGILSQKLAQTYIFAGPEDLGKTATAYVFAKNLLLSDPKRREEIEGIDPEKLEFSGDVHVLRREVGAKEIKVEQVRNFIHILGMGSFANSYKIGIIKEAESLSEESMNALLKLLEEPQDKTVIILIVSDLNALLKTIISRSQILNFRPIKADLIYDYLVDRGASKNQAKELSRLSSGRPALALKFLEDSESYNNYQNRVRVFVDILNSSLSDRFIVSTNLLSGSEKKGQEARQILSAILDIWLAVTRDLLLIKTDSLNLIQHTALESELVDLAERQSLASIKNIINHLKLAQTYLSANVNYKNILDFVSLNI